MTATIFTLFKANIQGGGRVAATSFVVSFVLALNRLNIVAVTTILVFHVGVIGHHVPRHIRASCSLAVRAMSVLNESYAVSLVGVVL